GIFLVLASDLNGYIVIDGGQARDQLAISAFLLRFAYLLRDDVGQRSGPHSIEQRFRIGQRIERKVRCNSDRPQRRNDRPLRQRLDQHLLESLRLFHLLMRGCEYIFVDEALFRQRATKVQDVALDVAAGDITGNVQDFEANAREEPLELDVANGGGFEDAAQ